jgi:hypothetical protein
MEEAVRPPRLGVVVPVHNGEATLPRVLDALSADLREIDRLVVADDRSSDSSAGIARSFGAEVVPSRAPGASAARNSGAVACDTDWLLFVDSDAVPRPGWRRRLDARMGSGCDGVQGVYAPRAPGSSAATFYKNYYYHYTFTRRIGEGPVPGCGTFFLAVRRAVFEELGGFDARIVRASVEDADFAERLSGAGGTIVMAPEIEVYHLREYGLRDLLGYEWAMVKAKVHHLLRRGAGHGPPSLSLAGPSSMLAVASASLGVWGLLFSLVLLGLGAGWAVWPAAASALMVGALLPFWASMVISGGLRGLRACPVSLGVHLVHLPAAVAACFEHIAGRRY